MGVKTRYSLALAALLVAAAAAAFFLLHRQQPTPRPAPPPAAATSVPATPTSTDCFLPGPAPVPPDGRTATTAEMQLGHDVIQRFVEQLEHYQACLNNKIDHAAPGVTQQQKDTWIHQGNAAVDDANALAQAYSAQIRIFKARKPK
jgi:hypothetical protein